MAKIFVFTIVIFAAIIMNTKAQTFGFGGLGEHKPANDDINALVEKHRASIIQKINSSGSSSVAVDAKFVVNGYKTQSVSGTNYFISLTTGGAIYHVKIYSQSWTSTEEVQAVQGPKEAADEISYFY